MNKRMKIRAGVVVCLVVAMAQVAGSRANVTDQGSAGGAVGIFEGSGDVGNVEARLKGGVVYDAVKGTYTVSGSGENMWLGSDAFQFVWKRASGDVEISADISFLGEGKNPHRKAVVMVRQSLDADSAYADVALHGVGLTSLQFREEKGATTQEVQANVNAPKKIRLVKRGGYYTMWVAGADGKLVMAGASPRIEMKEPFYVGIGMCSHDKEVMEKAVFSEVSVKEIRVEGKGVQGPETSDQEAQNQTNSSGAKAQFAGGKNVGAGAPPPDAVRNGKAKKATGDQGPETSDQEAQNQTNSSGAKAQFAGGKNVGAEAPPPDAVTNGKAKKATGDQRPETSDQEAQSWNAQWYGIWAGGSASKARDRRCQDAMIEEEGTEKSTG